MPTDCIMYLWIHWAVFEVGTIGEVLDYGFMKKRYDQGMNGGDWATFLPIRANSNIYTLEQLRKFKIYKKIVLSEIGISDLTLLERRVAADNVAKAQVKRISVETFDVFMKPKFDKIVNVDDKLKDTNRSQHPPVAVITEDF